MRGFADHSQLGRMPARGVAAVVVALSAILLCGAPNAAGLTHHFANCRAGEGAPWYLYTSHDRSAYFVGHWYSIRVSQSEPNRFGGGPPERLCPFIRSELTKLTRVKNHRPTKRKIAGVNPHDTGPGFSCIQEGSVFALTNYRSGWDEGSRVCTRTIQIGSTTTHVEQSFTIVPDGAPPNCDYVVDKGQRDTGPCGVPVPPDARRGF